MLGTERGMHQVALSPKTHVCATTVACGFPTGHLSILLKFLIYVSLVSLDGEMPGGRDLLRFPFECPVLAPVDERL